MNNGLRRNSNYVFRNYESPLALYNLYNSGLAISSNPLNASKNISNNTKKRDFQSELDKAIKKLT